MTLPVESIRSKDLVSGQKKWQSGSAPGTATLVVVVMLVVVVTLVGVVKPTPQQTRSEA